MAKIHREHDTSICPSESGTAVASTRYIEPVSGQVAPSPPLSTLRTPMKDDKKLDYIDALRGIAILGVIFSHSGELASTEGSISAQGARGVQLFFVISAFTLLLSMQSRLALEARPIRNFFIRRFFRIAPLFYVAVCVSLSLDGLSARFWAPFGLHASSILMTVLFVNGWNPYSINSVFGGGWSIAVEMMFYCILPLLFIQIRSFTGAFAAWVAATISGALMCPIASLIAGSNCPGIIEHSFETLWLPSQLPVFLSGFLLFFALRDDVKPFRFAFIQAMCIAVLGIEYFANRRFGTPFDPHPVPTVAGIFASGLAYFLASRRIFVLVNPVTGYIGKVSYSGYISQFWVIRMLTPLKSYFAMVPSHFQFVASFCLITIGTTAISAILHRFIELPGRELGHKLINRLSKPRWVVAA